MKTQLQIQRAHDVLLAYVLDEVPVQVTQEQRNSLAQFACTLCWVLDHDHQPKFNEVLAELEKTIESVGGIIERRDN